MPNDYCMVCIDANQYHLDLFSHYSSNEMMFRVIVRSILGKPIQPMTELGAIAMKSKKINNFRKDVGLEE